MPERDAPRQAPLYIGPGGSNFLKQDRSPWVTVPDLVGRSCQSLILLKFGVLCHSVPCRAFSKKTRHGPRLHARAGPCLLFSCRCWVGHFRAYMFTFTARLIHLPYLQMLSRFLTLYDPLSPTPSQPPEAGSQGQSSFWSS